MLDAKHMNNWELRCHQVGSKWFLSSLLRRCCGNTTVQVSTQSTRASCFQLIDVISFFYHNQTSHKEMMNKLSTSFIPWHPVRTCFTAIPPIASFGKAWLMRLMQLKWGPREIHCLAALQVATDHLRRLELWSHQIMILSKSDSSHILYSQNHINRIIHWHSLKNNCHHNRLGSHLVNHRRLLLALHLPVDQLQSEDQSGKGWKRNSLIHDRLAATPDYCE